MNKIAFALLSSSLVCTTAQAGPVTANTTAEVTQIKEGFDLRTVATFNYSGRVSSNDRALWDVTVRCERRNLASGEVTILAGSGSAMIAQGSLSGNAAPLGEVDLLTAENDTSTSKGKLFIGDGRCASGVPMVKEKQIGKPAPEPVTPIVQASINPLNDFVDIEANLQGRPWGHNGSTMFADLEKGIIAYDVPKKSIKLVVSRGTVLFRGALSNNKPIKGIAYAYKEGCPPAPYPVVGGYTDYMYTLTLRGAGPIRQGCEVIGYSDRSPHSVLRFSYLMND